MAQLGAAADSAGQRTTPQTAQQVIAALYGNSASSPILSGGAVSGTATLAYHVSAGVGVLSTGSGAVYTAWGDTDTSLTSPPAVGTATDTIGADADGVVHVWRGDAPAGTVILDRRTVPAGCTATTATTSAYDRRYAMPYGARLGELAYWQENAAPGTKIAGDWSTTMSFALPQDRGIAVEICQELHTDTKAEVNPASILWSVSLDGGAPVRFELPVDRRWVLRQHTLLFRWVHAGRHTVRIDRHRQWQQQDTEIYHFGGADGYQVGYYRVQDTGPVE